MLTIGLTGGIACGKSTVSKLLRELGVPVVDQDAVVHALYAPGTAVTESIGATFGDDVFTSEGAINRQALGAIVFADVQKRKLLESIVRPAVAYETKQGLENAREVGHRVAVVDSPLLLESGNQRHYNEVWVVSVSPEVQLERLMSRNHFSQEEALRRIAAQMPLKEKSALADVIIDNGGTVEETKRQVESALLRTLLGPTAKEQTEYAEVGLMFTNLVEAVQREKRTAAVMRQFQLTDSVSGDILHAIRSAAQKGKTTTVIYVPRLDDEAERMLTKEWLDSGKVCGLDFRNVTRTDNGSVIRGGINGATRIEIKA